MTSKSEVLNLRLSAEIKQAIASLAIEDGRSMSQIALRAIEAGLAAITPIKGKPTPKPKPKGKGKGGDGGAAPAPKPKK